MINIGILSRHAEISAKTIRYYESVGVMPEPARGGNGYRQYTEMDLETLRFIRRARDLGFSVKEVGDLMKLWHDRSRASADVKAIALNHIDEIEQRISKLKSIRRTLINLTERCHGDDRPDCPILDDLVRGESAEPRWHRDSPRKA